MGLIKIPKVTWVYLKKIYLWPFGNVLALFWPRTLLMICLPHHLSWKSDHWRGVKEDLRTCAGQRSSSNAHGPRCTGMQCGSHDLRVNHVIDF